MHGLHHATLLRTEAVATLDLTPLVEDRELTDDHVPQFGIDDARALISRAYMRPNDAAEQLLAVRTNFITLEAQNALLKLLEEPPVSTRFVFVVPFSFTVLPTLSSRFFEYQTDRRLPTSVTNTFVTFQEQSIQERLGVIEVAAKQKDHDWQHAIKQGLGQYLSSTTLDVATLTALEYVARTLLTRGASNKMLLEHMAFHLPHS
ncbi:hypothetical protein KC906_04295 [Candidatus Kaiserbacteria bacterium]|nr:hypothetical protein [Candidatus Kaiserbacteria bacterium]